MSYIPPSPVNPNACCGDCIHYEPDSHDFHAWCHFLKESVDSLGTCEKYKEWDGESLRYWDEAGKWLEKVKRRRTQ